MSEVRVYKLAKELGVESKTVLSMIKELRGRVRSASSTVDPALEQRIRALAAGALPWSKWSTSQASPKRSTQAASKPSVQAQETTLHPDVVKPGSGPRRKVADRRPRAKRDARPGPDEWTRNFFSVEDRDAWQAVGIYRPTTR